MSATFNATQINAIRHYLNAVRTCGLATPGTVIHKRSTAEARMWIQVWEEAASTTGDIMQAAETYLAEQEATAKA
jgi:hypothetical protein